MDFTLSDDQQLLRSSVRTMLAKECPPSLVRAHTDDPAAADPLSAHLQEFTALADGPLVDLCLMLEELGAVAAPGPFFATTALYRPLARRAGIEPCTSGTVALAGADGEWVVNGDTVKTFVPEADRVEQILVVHSGPVVAPATSPVTCTEIATVDPSRRVFELDTRDLAAGHAVDASDLDDWLARATVALAAEMVGTARTLVAMSIEYAKHRVQFDKPIGAFQAIQHKLADMSLASERAWSAVYYAAMAHDAGDADRHRATHVAKAAAGEAVIRGARDGIQVHGGIGYTWEHDLHLFLRRAYASEHFMGTTSWHHDRLADLLLA